MDDMSLDAVSGLLGDAAAQRLTRKHRGGVSNEKGGDYELAYCIFAIGLMVPDMVGRGSDSELETQAFAFVDDVVVRCGYTGLTRYAQLKDVSQLGWSSASTKLDKDFDYQRLLCEHKGEPFKLDLVVSSEPLHNKMLGTMPPRIQGCTDVVLFPRASGLRMRLWESEDFRSCLASVCGHKEPGIGDLEVILEVLAGGLSSRSNRKISIRQFLDRLRESHCCYIRTLNDGESIRPAVREILGGINGFEFELYRGYLHWRFDDAFMDGCLRYSCGSEKFEQFQDLIESRRPASFDELEGYLL